MIKNTQLAGAFALILTGQAVTTLAQAIEYDAQPLIHTTPAERQAAHQQAQEQFAKTNKSAREKWSALAQNGLPELVEATEKMRQLYEQNGDVEARDAWVKLLLQQGRRREALDACVLCSANIWSVETLEPLARAARDERDFVNAVLMYRELQKKSPKNKAGWLGLMLTAIDARDFALAQQMAEQYQTRFGSDNELVQAQLHLEESQQSNTDRLKQAQAQLETDPNNPTQIRAVFQAAACLKAYPIQEDLLNKHAELFSQNDVLWLKHSKAVFLNRTGAQMNDPVQLKQANALLLDVVANAPAGSELSNLARQDLVDSLVRIKQYRAAIKESDRLLLELKVLPFYVQEARADAWAALNYPFKALEIYRQIAAKLPIDHRLQQKIISANADAERYERAQQQIDALKHDPEIGDFTGTRQLDNPAYYDLLFWQIRLHAWRGDNATARILVDEWLQHAPADPWGLMLKGDIARYQMQRDEAHALYTNAQARLSPKDTYFAKAKLADLALDSGDWRTVVADIQTLPAYKEDTERLNERLGFEQAAQLFVQAGRRRTTQPRATTHESQHDAYLYSPRLSGGHRLFVHQQDVKTPEDNQLLRNGFTGLGAELYFYPAKITVEAGAGTQLNQRGYAWLDGQYRFNQHWQGQVSFKLNSDDVSAKALRDNVYGNQLSASATYTANEWRSAGAGVDAMRMSDGNQRLGVHAWLRQDLVRHDRWQLNSYTNVSASKNRTLVAAYYNPAHDVAAQSELSLAYRQPIDGQISLVSSIAAGAGHYWQSDYAGQNTWLLRARQDWNFGPRFGVGYEFGRRKSIYDGLAELQNYGSIMLNVRFK